MYLNTHQSDYQLLAYSNLFNFSSFKHTCHSQCFVFVLLSDIHNVLMISMFLNILSYCYLHIFLINNTHVYVYYYLLIKPLIFECCFLYFFHLLPNNFHEDKNLTFCMLFGECYQWSSIIFVPLSIWILYSSSVSSSIFQTYFQALSP